MSKEQTPITAKGFLKEQGIERCTAYCSDIKDRTIDETLKTLYIDKLCDVMEQYANAKVLEALEREFSQVAIFDKNGKSKTGIDYYETEVKPKYER